jgi:hypothetical protein
VTAEARGRESCGHPCACSAAPRRATNHTTSAQARNIPEYPQKAAAWKLPTLRLAVLNRSCLSFLGWPQRRRRYVCACASACVRAVRFWPGSTMIKICSILLMARGVCPMMIFAGGA